jgi:hypothetical protein
MRLCFILILNFLVPSNLFAQGSCGSPDGATDEIAAPPTSYQELEDGGYCMDGTGSTSWHAMCFTFTTAYTAVDINMGYSSNCANAGFRGFELFDNTCTSVGTGLSYTGLTIGESYTFCVEMRANGGPGCNGFDRVCPYWMEGAIPVPIELVKFDCKESIVEWSTASERNNDGFYLASKDGTILGWVNGMGNSNTYIDYYYELDQCVDFVKLIQQDYDGKTTEYNYEDCNCKKTTIQQNFNIWEYYNLLGQRIR